MVAKKSECEDYARYNSLCRSGEIVLFGSSFAADLPLTELAQDFNIEEKLYNRSIHGLTVCEAKDYLKNCVEELAPRKVFINIGDADLDDADFNLEQFISEYEWLLYQIHSSVNRVRLYIMSVCSKNVHAAELNQALRELAAKTGCTYLDVTRYAFQNDGKLRVFRAMRNFFRPAPLTFADAMQYC